MDDHHETKDEMRCATSQEKTKVRGKKDYCPCNSSVNKCIRLLILVQAKHYRWNF